MRRAQATACFHCGLPVVPPCRHRALLLGAERELCCAGCQAVANTIAAAGLESYYETRSAPGAPPAELPAVPNYDESAQGCDVSLILEGVRCAACLWLIEQVLRRLPGVIRADVNYATQRAHVAWDAGQVKLSRIIEAVRGVGYDASPYDPRLQQDVERRERRTALWRLFVAGFGAMQVMMYAFPAYLDDGALTPEAEGLMRWAGLLLTIPVILFSCAPFFSGAMQELRQRRLGLDTPIALGLGAGFLASAWATLSGTGVVYFDSISMLTFLLLGARYVEAAARRRAARSLDPLLRLNSSRKISVGEAISIAPGERIPADGVVVSGCSSADESLLTGESRAVEKGEGDELIAGSVNLEQPLLMRTTRVGQDTRAAAIARLVERGAASKPMLVDAAERVARYLTWLILLTALLSGWYFENLWIAVAVLVVACPCALALAAPVVLTRASGALLARGVLLARGRALDTLRRATDVVLDKTGTLTSGRLAVCCRAALGGLGEQACLRIAGALEAGSLHPIARAFPPHDLSAEGVRHVPGMGIEGWVEGRLVRIGNARFCSELCRRPGPMAGSSSRTQVFLADEGGWLAIYDLYDELRPDAQDLVWELKRRRIRVHLASGDSPGVVLPLARRLGIGLSRGAMTPQDKFDYVERLQSEGGVVVMIGDGLNDAPVLARADASFAMGCGADAAQLRADVVLLGNALAEIPLTFNLAQRAMHLVRQNLAWALAYNAVALPLAATGWIGPWEAALAMGASSLTVLLNALRPLNAPQSHPVTISRSKSGGAAVICSAQDDPAFSNHP